MEANARSLDGALCLGVSVAVLHVNGCQNWRWPALAASLLFAMRKFKNQPGPLRAVATVHMVRNPHNRLRVGRIGVDLQFGTDASQIAMLDRILAQFEEFCVVTRSV